MSLKDLSSFQTLLISNLSNTVEVSIQHPLFVLKNHLQYGKKIKYSIRNLYSGYFFNLYSLNCITSFQYLTYGYLYKKTKKDFQSSIISGTLSGFIASPFEYCSINKKKEDSLIKTLKRREIYTKFYIGLPSTLMRESIYTFGLLSLNPMIENKIKSKYSGIYSSIISGLICTILTQPFDTIKTYQQYNQKNIYPNYNLLYYGITYRTIRIINTYFILNEFNKLFLKLYNKID